MGRFIFKNPFVTKNSINIAMSHMKMAEILINAAEEWYKDDDGSYTEKGHELMLRAFKHMNIAAKKAGFRNVADMHTYIKRHGKI